MRPLPARALSFPAGRVVLLAILIAACSANESGRVTADGTIELTQTEVAPVVAGRVVRVWVDEGHEVHRGDTLVTLEQATLPADIEQLRAQVASAEARVRDLRAGARPAEIERAEAELRSATAEAERRERDRARFEALLEAGSISQAEYDAAATAARTAAARRDAAGESLRLLRQGARSEQIAAARAELESARAALAAGRATVSELVLIAPDAGTVLGRHVEPGEVIGAGQSALTLGDAKHPWVRVYVEAPVLPALKVGQPVLVTVAGLGDRTVAGHIASIATKAEFTPRVALTEEERADLLFGVKVDVRDTTGAFKAGLPATVLIDTTAVYRREP